MTLSSGFTWEMRLQPPEGADGGREQREHWEAEKVFRKSLAQMRNVLSATQLNARLTMRNRKINKLTSALGSVAETRFRASSGTSKAI